MAKYDIADMKNLNDAQKQAITQSINNATLRTEVKQLHNRLKILTQ